MFRSACLIAIVVLAGCNAGGHGFRPVPGIGAGGHAAAPGTPAPLPTTHPLVEAIPTTEFAVPEYGLSGRYPRTWALPKRYQVDTNTVFELEQGADTYFRVGFLPGVRSVVAKQQPDLPANEIADAVLAYAAQAAAESDIYFIGTERTLLDSSVVQFGAYDVRTITLLIARPVNSLAAMTDDERFSQAHYINLAPEGQPRLSRQYVWLVGDDVWIAEVVAPIATFAERATEAEEVILPHLAWGPRGTAGERQT
ncbi:MAG: hypothetical protein ABI743_07425 [bacterium]